MQCRVDWQRWRHVLELRYWQVQKLVRICILLELPLLRKLTVRQRLVK
jgi:hypothetical protein